MPLSSKVLCAGEGREGKNSQFLQLTLMKDMCLPSSEINQSHKPELMQVEGKKLASGIITCNTEIYQTRT